MKHTPKFLPEQLFSHLKADLKPYLRGATFSLSDNFIVSSDFCSTSLKAIASYSLLNSIFKKYEDGGVQKDKDDAALALFKSFNSACAVYRPPYTGLVPDINPHMAVLYNQMKAILNDMFFAEGLHSFSEVDVWDQADIGPGASRLSSGNSFYEKLAAGRISTTNRSLYNKYCRYISSYPTWFAAELTRRARFGVVDVIDGNKLSYVPKNSSISRTICTEPLLNMFFQRGLAKIFDRIVLHRTGFHKSVQPDRNRRLAKIGSVSGAFSTIDLSNASDSISMAFLRDVLPKYVVDYLVLSRSPSTELPDGSSEALHMVSSMGNGYTFSLMTLLLSAMVLAVYKVNGVKFRRPSRHSFKELGNAAVFGDDIIVEQRMFDEMISLLKLCGFTPNEKKSFTIGGFRESCGRDYLYGHDVRGVYCTRVRTIQEVYSLVNRLNVWSTNQSIFLPRAVSYLQGLAPYVQVPFFEDDSSGFKVPRSLITHVKLDRHTKSLTYKRYVAKAVTVRLDNVQSTAMAKTIWANNPDGILLAAVKGTLLGGVASIKSLVVHYKLRRGMAPCWDPSATVLGDVTPGWGRRWETAVWVNTK